MAEKRYRRPRTGIYRNVTPSNNPLITLGKNDQTKSQVDYKTGAII